jgi:bacillithiol biosynthesis cysteine-adding enzyme BshC
MVNKATHIYYEATGSFSKMVVDYVKGDEKLQPFYKHPVSMEGIAAAIAERKLFATNRKLLVDVLAKHYQHANPTELQLQNIQMLSNANCFTVTTAHQPNIFTGHLYFIYKILHTIKLCENLKLQMPENDFVPVFYMGSEDADLEELGHIYVNGIKHDWNTNQTGAVGRMKVDKALLKILDDIAREITVEPNGKEIIDLMQASYIEGSTIEQTTFKLINALFGDYGLIVLLPDDVDYKRAFIPVVEKELKEQFSYPIVEEAVALLPKEYKAQAGGRELNMFYLKDDIRERVEKKNDQYLILNTKSVYSEAEMMQELEKYPERFSPNVILRPVFQEMILPNIAFIGGGGEIAYWLELRKVFEAVQVPFPVLVLRNSLLLIEKKHVSKINSLGFSAADLFQSENDLMSGLVKKRTELRLSLEKERQAIHSFYAQLKNTAAAVDVTLGPHTEALEKQALKKIDALEKKMLRAEKKKFDAQQRQVSTLKSQLFPHNNLQERIENFMPFYAKWGTAFTKAVYQQSLGLQQQFVILEEE